MKIRINVDVADVLNYDCDVLALKHAQSLYGVDWKVFDILEQQNPDLDLQMPGVNDSLLINSVSSINAKSVLFIGVKPLWQFYYQEIREFAQKVLVSLNKKAPDIRSLSLTLHGAEYGLDEIEAFKSEIAGLIDAIKNGAYPKNLEKITIVEIDGKRAERLNKVLSDLLPSGYIDFKNERSSKDEEEIQAESISEAGLTLTDKPYIFVAMPFEKTMDDIFHYGIQGAVHNVGFLCERADNSYFTGNIMDWVKRRIKNAKLIVADLTNSNPNVYLEVGFTWGCNKPTILLIKKGEELKFDVQGERCVIYSSIKDLEEKLTKEIEYFFKQNS